MCTSTVAVADALPAQPARLIDDSTVVRSGICTSVLLVAVQLVGDGDGLGDGVGLGDAVGVGLGDGVGLGLGVGVGPAPRLMVQVSMRPTSAAAASWTRSFQVPLVGSDDRFTV